MPKGTDMTPAEREAVEAALRELAPHDKWVDETVAKRFGFAPGTMKRMRHAIGVHKIRLNACRRP